MFRNNSSSKPSFGQKEGNFDKPPVRIRQKSENSRSKNENVENFWFFHFLSPQSLSADTQSAVFTTPLKTFCHKAVEELINDPIRWINYRNFQKKGCSETLRLLTRQFWQLRWKKKDESLKFVCSKSANEKNRPENFFHWMSSWTGIMHIWQLRRKLFHQRPTIFCSFTEKKENFQFLQRVHFAWKGSNGHVECSFVNSDEKNQQKSVKFSLIDRNWWKNLIFSTTFLSIFPTNTEYGALTTQPETNNQNAKFFLAQCLKMIKEIYNFFKEMIFFLKMLLRTPRMQFWQNSPKNFNQKLEMFAHCAKMIK